jgi:uroporphyrinogen-III synthase
MMGGGSVTELVTHTLIAAIGPVTADAARSLGMNVAIVPKKHTVSALVEAIAAYFKITDPTYR